MLTHLFTSSARPAVDIPYGQYCSDATSPVGSKGRKRSLSSAHQNKPSRIVIVIIGKCKHHSGSFAEFAGCFDGSTVNRSRSL